VIYAASVLAANSVLRSLFGAAFPLFTTYMYQNLGIHWASSVPGFLALMCVPFPFLFYKYGESIRLKCKYAAEAAEALEKMRSRSGEETMSESESVNEGEKKAEEKVGGGEEDRGVQGDNGREGGLAENKMTQ